MCGVVGKFELAEQDELQAVFRTDINAATAEDALTSIRLGPFKDGVDPAPKATRRFSPSLLFCKAGFDFGYAGATFERDDRYGQA